jgi:hypothetical protein
MPRSQPAKQCEAPRRNRADAVAAGAGPAAAMAFARAGFDDPSLVLRWAEIAGPELARLAQPLRLAHGRLGDTLTLRAVPGAALFLAHEKRALAERINAYLGRPAVTRITFVQGVMAGPPLPGQAGNARGCLRGEDPAAAYRGPPGLQKALENLARRRNPAS